MCKSSRYYNNVIATNVLLSVLGVISLPGDRISSSSWSTSNRRRSIFDRRMEGDETDTTLMRACAHYPGVFFSHCCQRRIDSK